MLKSLSKNSKERESLLIVEETKTKSIRRQPIEKVKEYVNCFSNFSDFLKKYPVFKDKQCVAISEFSSYLRSVFERHLKDVQ